MVGAKWGGAMRGGFVSGLLGLAACGLSGVDALQDQGTTGGEMTGWAPHAEDQDRPHLDLGQGVQGPYLPHRDPEDRPDVTVYGYWPYWGDSLDTLAWDQLTDLALFGVELASDGSLTYEDRWHEAAPQAMELAAPYGVRVHLTLICFSDPVMASVLPDPAKRALTIAEVSSLVERYGAHGVNVDFEGLDRAYKHDFTAFVQEMSEELEDVVVAMPAVDWDGAYDYDELAFASDGLFIMGYGYHWSGGNPGPVAPLYGGGIWGTHSLAWTVEDYVKWGAPPDKIILGLPLYGRLWPTVDSAVPGDATGEGEAVTYSGAQAMLMDHSRRWDASTATPYLFPSTDEQLWYDDAESLEAKMAYAVDQELQGFGFWALTYEDTDPELWGIVDGLTHPQ